MIEYFQANFNTFLEMEPFAKAMVAAAGLVIWLVVWRIRVHL
jgi:hypothetical protein